MRLFDEYWNILESKTVKQQELPVSTTPHTMTIGPNDCDGHNNIDPLDQYMIDYDSDNIINVNNYNDHSK